MPSARLRNVLLPLACSATLTAIVTWPLLLTTGKIRDWCDVLFSTWVLAWGTHALATAPASIANANIFWPDPDALFYGPAALGALPWFAPVYLATGNPVRAVNVAFLICFAATGAALHWVVWRWSRSHAAGFVAAATFLTTPWLSQLFVPLTPHLAALQLFPVVVYLASTDLAPMRARLVLGGAIVLQCLTDLVYVAPAVLAPLAALAAIRLVRGSTRRSGARLATVVVLSTLVLAPLLLRYASVSAAAPELTLWTSKGMRTTYLPGDLRNPLRPAIFRLTALTVIVIGVALSLRRRGGLARLRRSSAWRSAGFWCAAGFVLTLGSPIVLGSLEVPGPQGLVAAWLPAIDRIRIPARLGVASLTGFSLLVGLAFAAIVQRVRLAVRPPPLAGACVAALALLAAASLWLDFGLFFRVPYGVTRVDAATPPASFLAALARGPGPLVEIPAGRIPLQTADNRRTGQPGVFAAEQARAMFNSTFHWHPILNGYSSYFPPGFVRRLKLADRLPDTAALATLLAETDLRFVWVHLDRLDDEGRARWTTQISLGAFARPPAIRLIAAEPDELLFIVDR